MKIWNLAVIFMMFAGGVFAQEQREIAALDLALEFEALQGQTVRVTGCTIQGANLDFMMCGVSSKSGSVGNLNIKVSKLDRTHFKAALEKCAGIMPGKNCRADVIGEIAKDSFGDASIIAHQILWAK